MFRRNHLLTGLCASLMAMGGVSCDSIDCSIDNVVQMNVALMGTVTSLDVDTLSVYAKTLSASDTLLLNSATGISSFSMPMSYSQEEDEWHLTLTDTLGNVTMDTIRYQKTNQPYFQSVDCSPQMHHTLTGITYTTNFLDSVVIHHPTVDNDATQQHLYLYLRNNE